MAFLRVIPSSLNLLLLTERRLSPVATTAVKTARQDSSKKSSEEHITDVRARQSPHLKSNQQRTFVPDFLVAWQVTRHITR